jgi:hypothetical protein
LIDNCLNVVIAGADARDCRTEFREWDREILFSRRPQPFFQESQSPGRARYSDLTNAASRGNHDSANAYQTGRVLRFGPPSFWRFNFSNQTPSSPEKTLRSGAKTVPWSPIRQLHSYY